MTDRDAWTPEQIDAVAAALAAEAGVHETVLSPPEAAVVEQGRTLIADEGRCGSCHHYVSRGADGVAVEDNGVELGSAPDLAGWGGREWLIGIIRDPTHERFYPDSNDRMPSFGVAAEGSMPPLSEKEIELIADWLRGQWYRRQ